MRSIAAADDPIHFNETLHSICVPRVVGTPGHERVKDFIVAELTALGMSVELDTFSVRAPIVGKQRFTNVIGRLNPRADRFLTLACHYDSKYFAPQSGAEAFVGATDSAVPCAMMLNAVRTLRGPLSERPAGGVAADVSLMLIFFDGEEAFDQWTDTDSLYGSRHLVGRLPDIERIDALVLLDLIGAPTTTIPNYFAATLPLFQRLVGIERALFREGQMVGNRYMFRAQNSRQSIADDHLPFLDQGESGRICLFDQIYEIDLSCIHPGVPIVHLISNPFPAQWHTIDDDIAHLDGGVMANFNKILRCFTFEYLTASQSTVNFRVFG